MNVPTTVAARFGRGVTPLALILVMAFAGCARGGAGGPRGGGFRPPPMPGETAAGVQGRGGGRVGGGGARRGAGAVTGVSESDGVVVRLPLPEGDAVQR